MNLSLSTFPQTLDMLHLLLGLAALLLLVIVVVRKPQPASAGVSKPPLSASTGNAPVTPAPAVSAPASPEVVAAPVVAPVPAASLRTAEPESALQLLGLLQQEARLIDFLQEDLKGFSDAEVGAAARVVHEGGRRLLGEYIHLAAVRSETEESRITLPAGFDAASVRLTGNVTGQPPFTGTLVHRGWKVVELTLPALAEGRSLSIIAPAEVEL
jgi:hypothetical protein